MIASVFANCLNEDCCLGNLPSVFSSLFFAILFLQSGLDKIINYQSERSWIREHFSKSIFAKLTTNMFVVLIFLELITGALSLVAPLLLWFAGNGEYLLLAHLFSGFTLLLLFFGQRVAKDYTGAASLTGYFVISMLGIYLCL